MVADLPEPARCHLTYAVAPGKPIRTVVKIGIIGEIGLGDQANPNYPGQERRGEIEAVRFDLLDPSAHRAALQGVERVFLMRPGRWPGPRLSRRSSTPPSAPA